MPMSSESGDKFIFDWFVAAMTFGSEHSEEVISAIGDSILFVETVVPKGLATIGTREMFGVEGFTKGSYAALKFKKKLSLF